MDSKHTGIRNPGIFEKGPLTSNGAKELIINSRSFKSQN